jgi:hypothetical protein
MSRYPRVNVSTPSSPERLAYRIPEVQAMFGVARSTIYHWIETGRLERVEGVGMCLLTAASVNRAAGGKAA